MINRVNQTDRWDTCKGLTPAWAEFGFFLGGANSRRGGCKSKFSRLGSDVFPFRAELTTGGVGVLSESFDPFLRVFSILYGGPRVRFSTPKNCWGC